MNRLPEGWRRAVGKLILLAGFGLLAAAACTRSLQAVPLLSEDFHRITDPGITPPPATLPPFHPVEPQERVMNSVTVTIVYNNVGLDPELETDWGFSAWVETGDEVVMFDTGARGDILLDNMEKLGLDPARVDYLVFSHRHDDHTGGAQALLDSGARPVSYVLENFPPGFQIRLVEQTEMVVVNGPQQITGGIYTTGPVAGEVTEQALIVETGQGLVVITGCAHPGVNRMVAQARQVVSGPVHLVLGGFHLGAASTAAVEAIIADFRGMEVENAAPSHCTGGPAISRFQQEYGEHFQSSGLGAVFTFD